MAEIDLTKYGITGVTEIVHNPSYEMLFEEETKPNLEGYEKGQVSELGAVNVMTGIYTGRSPKDKFIVEDENSKDTVWWTSDEYKNDNHPASQETWNVVKDIALKELSGKRLFVVDAFCGANHDTRMSVRFIVEVAWQSRASPRRKPFSILSSLRITAIMKDFACTITIPQISSRADIRTKTVRLSKKIILKRSRIMI